MGAVGRPSGNPRLGAAVVAEGFSSNCDGLVEAPWVGRNRRLGKEPGLFYRGRHAESY